MDAAPSVADQAIDNVLEEELYCCLAKLDDADRKLLGALFFGGKSERGLADELNIPRNTLTYRKSKALERLKILMNI